MKQKRGDDQHYYYHKLIAQIAFGTETSSTRYEFTHLIRENVPVPILVDVLRELPSIDISPLHW